MDFKELLKKAIYEIKQADYYIEKAERTEDVEIAKIYHKIAQDELEHFNMFHQIIPVKLRQEIGSDFNETNPMFEVMHGAMKEWVGGIKEKITNFQK